MVYSLVCLIVHPNVNSFSGGILVLEVVSAQNIPPPKGMFGAASVSPHVKVFCGKKPLGQTPKISNTLNPRWQHRFNSMELMPTDSTCITFEIYDENTFSKDVLLSTCIISLSDLLITSAEDREHSLDLFTNPNPDGNSSISIKIQFTINKVFDLAAGEFRLL
jgi:Ca2+-dependent lipid-binding protein